MAQIPKFLLFFQQYISKLDGRSGVYVNLLLTCNKFCKLIRIIVTDILFEVSVY